MTGALSCTAREGETGSAVLPTAVRSLPIKSEEGLRGGERTDGAGVGSSFGGGGGGGRELRGVSTTGIVMFSRTARSGREKEGVPF